MNKKGVTLIELVIVFIIIAIGAVLLTPNIGPWIQNYRLRSATRDIVSTLRTAQMKAVSTNIEYRVNFDGADIGTNNYILQYNSGGWRNEGVIQKLPAGVTLTNTFPGNHAEFHTNSTASGGTVRLTNTKGTERTITVLFTTGRITARDP